MNGTGPTNHLRPSDVQDVVLSRGALLALACDVVLRQPEDFETCAVPPAFSIVGMHPHHATAFEQRLLSRLRSPVIVCVIDNEIWSSVVSFPPPEDRARYVRDVIESSRVAHWFAENAWFEGGSHPKVTPLPIGLAWKSMREPAIFAALQRSMRDAPPVGRKPLVARATFHFANYARPKSLWTPNERAQVRAALAHNRSVHFASRRTTEAECWRQQAQYAFEVSPPGNGLDCHRTYEALLLNTIPIVPVSPLAELYRQFPIVIVEKWSDVTPENLHRWREELAPQFTPELRRRLTTTYWVDRIRLLARTFQSNDPRSK